MKNHPVEEKYPLLLLYVEENGKKSDFPQRVMFTDRARGKGIIDGAATIITQWPAQVTSCWLLSVISFTFLVLTLVIFVTILNPLFNPMHPRCTRGLKNYPESKVIHVVKNGIEWNTKQLDLLKFIAETYPNYEINNVIVDVSKKKLMTEETQVMNTTVRPIPNPTTPIANLNSSLAISTHRKNSLLFPEITSIFFRKFNEILARDRELFNKVDNNFKEEKDILFIPDFVNLKRYKREVLTYKSVLDDFKNIKERKASYKDYFKHTPLSYYWQDLNQDMLVFAVRVQEIWQNGGVSFMLLENPEGPDLATWKDLVVNTKYKFEILPNESVSVDDKGWHLATRTPCHSIFGEMLMRMKKDSEKLTVPTFVAEMLRVYCKRGAIDSDYCKRTQIK